MGMAKIGNWFRRQDIAYLGIQQRENSVYMIMVAEKEGEDYEIIWQNQITEDIAQEELLEKACLLADSSQQRNIICCLGLSQQDVYFYVEPGKYKLKVVVGQKLTDGWYSQNEFSTPHRQPVVVKEKEISIIYYDGNGIYQN